MIKLLTIKETADKLGLSEQKVYMMAQQQEIPAKKIGGRWKVHPERLQEWVNQQFA